MGVYQIEVQNRGIDAVNENLGLQYMKEASCFRVWAPTALKVELMLYKEAGLYGKNGKVTNQEDGASYEMIRLKNGVWERRHIGDTIGQYYLYKVSFEAATYFMVDPYAKATSANGQRGAIVNLEQTNPSEWEIYKQHPDCESTKAIIYELHVRDFSMDPKMPFKYPGKYLAFTEEGLRNSQGEKIGIDHLEELGITHVQLMPVFDFDVVNEIEVDAEDESTQKFNWGYDPQNYNVPEGSYATDVTRPEVRIREFKEMIKALHKKGIGVIMDVVYNHTFDIEQGPFEHLVPGYYYRKDKEGNFANGSGCGNEVASERPMVRKYIKESLAYWVREYGIDGFRFDLMALIDVQTIDEVVSELRSTFNKNILIYGEPWHAGGTVLGKRQQTGKWKQRGKGFAVFNDQIRDAIKGSNRGKKPGFTTGNWGLEKKIKESVQGSIHSIMAAPSETINYVDAHDDLILWDKVILTQDLEGEEGFVQICDGKMRDGRQVSDAVKEARPHHDVSILKPLENETVRRCVLSHAIVLTSQGIPLFHAGGEILRTKFGDENSYRSPDCINYIRWEDKGYFKEVFAYYKGLIALRKAHPIFSLMTKAEVVRHMVVYKAEEGIVAFHLKGALEGEIWQDVVVIYNSTTYEKEVALPFQGDWQVVVNEKQAGCEVLETLEETKKVSLPHLSVKILFHEKKE